MRCVELKELTPSNSIGESVIALSLLWVAVGTPESVLAAKYWLKLEPTFHLFLLYVCLLPISPKEPLLEFSDFHLSNSD